MTSTSGRSRYCERSALVVPRHRAHPPTVGCEHELRGDRAAGLEGRAVLDTALLVGAEAMRDRPEDLVDRPQLPLVERGQSARLEQCGARCDELIDGRHLRG